MQTEQFEISLGDLQRTFLDNEHHNFLCSSLLEYRDRSINVNTTYDILKAFKEQLPEFCKIFGLDEEREDFNAGVLGELIDDTLFLTLYNGRMFRILVLEKMIEMYGPEKKLVITESIKSNAYTGNYF